ncbi:hypothetical protein [Streptomyces sp. UNOB3_S3]|uniref:hypothetical protein n=1 Tax=Streptomyces sp. UNOB3_S3 TaxID=2871682 RepID=UPI001E45452F|nr:hypothetical protein [Streptomyces sp. UNOB3_S3]MCC3776269.1 hypothetical protein [Streptomyces sp. UNOB3_S3]
MHTYRIAGLAVAAVAVVAVSAPSSARAAAPAAPVDIDILGCVTGGGWPSYPGNDDGLGVLDDDNNSMVCQGGSHNGEPITLASGGGRGDRPYPGHRPPGGHRPTNGHLPGLGERPSGGHRPTPGHLPGLGDRPSGGHHRY